MNGDSIRLSLGAPAAPAVQNGLRLSQSESDAGGQASIVLRIVAVVILDLTVH